MYSKTIFTVAALGAVASAFDLPDNLRKIYDNHIVRLKSKKSIIATNT